MYPQLINQASRLAPLLQRIIQRGGSFASPMWRASQVEAPTINTQPMSPGGQPQGPQVPISQSNYAPPASYAQGSDPMTAGGTPPNGPGLPKYTQNTPSPLDTAQWPYGPIGKPQVPTPQPRPAEAPPSQPDTGFFARNTAMMTDPVTGQFIDPEAAKAVRGPDLINKMLAYLHNKDIG